MTFDEFMAQILSIHTADFSLDVYRVIYDDIISRNDDPSFYAGFPSTLNAWEVYDLNSLFSLVNRFGTQREFEKEYDRKTVSNLTVCNILKRLESRGHKITVLNNKDKTIIISPL